jgi:hypothetical protein
MKRTACALLALVMPGLCATAQDTSRVREVAYKNVALSFDAKLAREFLAETVPAIPLVNKTDKPDGVWPAHSRITLRDSYVPKERKEAGGEYTEARIFVFPTSDPNEPGFDTDFPTTVQAAKDLAKLLAKRNPPRGEMIPFLPWADEGEAFIGKRKMIRFRNGRGVLFLTQFGQEKVPLNNGDLVYTFQGLTDDNAWYVSAMFPVMAPGLPFANPKDAARSAQEVERAVTLAAAKLEKVRAQNFTPALGMLENLIRSMKITPR